MNKKQITAVVDELVAKIADANNCDENSARALLGLYLKREAENIVTAASPGRADMLQAGLAS